MWRPPFKITQAFHEGNLPAALLSSLLVLLPTAVEQRRLVRLGLVPRRGALRVDKGCGAEAALASGACISESAVEHGRLVSDASQIATSLQRWANEGGLLLVSLCVRILDRDVLAPLLLPTSRSRRDGPT